MDESSNVKPVSDVREKAFQECWKLRYDAYKHLTTLNTGSIIIIIALLEKIFPHPRWKALVGLAFGLFVVSTILSFFLMFVCTNFIYQGRLNDEDREFGQWVIGGAFGGFLGGIICLVVFGVKNLYS